MSYWSGVVALRPKCLKLVNPVLLTLIKLTWRTALKHLKNKCLSAILLPRLEQVWIAQLRPVREVILMVLPTAVKIYRLANIHHH